MLITCPDCHAVVQLENMDSRASCDCPGSSWSLARGKGMPEGFFSISATEWAACPPAKAGDVVECPRCGEDHVLQAAFQEGQLAGLLCYFNCGEKAYLAVVDGRLITNAPVREL